MPTKDKAEFEAKEQEIKALLAKEESYWKEGEDREVEFDDRHQGVMFLAFAPLSAINALVAETNKQGFPEPRVLLPIEYTFPAFPTNKRNEMINFFKHFTQAPLKHFVDEARENFFIKKFVAPVLEKRQYKFMNYEKWKTDGTNKLLNLNLTPILSQHQEHYKKLLKDKEHIANYDALNSFSSTGYEPIQDALFGNKEPEIVNTDDKEGKTQYWK